jgi:hypothetical protein
VAHAADQTSDRFLEPSDRVAEVLFGLIMVLTFTGSLSVAEADRAEVRDMLIGALGCNFAWGVIDAILYLMGCLAEKGRSLRLLRTFQQAPNPAAERRAIADALPPLVAAALGPAEYDALRARLMDLPPAPPRPSLTSGEWGQGFGIFLWVFITTFPVAIPFLLTSNVAVAMRVSNAIAIVMLFVAGYAFGVYSEHRPWLSGLVMVALGSVLVAFTIALGG